MIVISVEAELVGMGKAVAEMLGIGTIAKDLGTQLRGVLHTDSFVVVAIVLVFLFGSSLENPYWFSYGLLSCLREI